MRRQDKIGERSGANDHGYTMYRSAGARARMQNGEDDVEPVGERVQDENEGGTGRHQEGQRIHGLRD